jgi:peptidyl-prolyl cis-trans isomerase C
MSEFKRAFPAAGLILALAALALAGCGLGGDRSLGSDSGVSDPIVAAAVNGRPIYNEDVRAQAVQTGRIQDGQELDPNSDDFYDALDELIQIRLFALEAESRGLDRTPDVRRRLEAARERVLAAAIYEDLDRKANDPEEIQKLYKEYSPQLGEGQEVWRRHIQFDTREAADAAKRRLDRGEQFTALAFELSTARDTAPDGGDLGYVAESTLPPALRTLVGQLNNGDVGGPVEAWDRWQLVRLEDRRESGVPSMESLRPGIVTWLRYEGAMRLQEKLAKEARIERAHERDATFEQPPADAGAPPNPVAGAAAAAKAKAPAPAQAQRQGRRPEPPPFPFPMGPGGVSSSGDSENSAAPAPSH